MSNEFRGRNGIISDGNLIVKQITTPDNPEDGYVKIYSKSDDKIYVLNKVGTEVELGAGADGATWYTDAGVPSDLIGNNNDLYLNETNSDVYKKLADTWGTPICNIKGQQGIQGNAGPQGTAGADGREVMMQSAGGYIQWKYDTDVSWTNLVALTSLKGDKGDTGDNIELQKSATHIQWRVVGDVTWIDLVPLADITGADGTDGQEVSMQVSGGYIQWRLGSGSWTNLILVADLKGDAGDAGADGKTWISAAGAPSDLIGVDGDFYLNETTYDVYKKAIGSWGSVLLNIKGATGAKGSTGEPGKTWYSGAGVPSDSLGIDGDFYLNETTYDVYKKATSTWGTALLNIKGAGVPTGGTQHQILAKIDATNYNTQWETVATALGYTPENDTNKTSSFSTSPGTTKYPNELLLANQSKLLSVGFVTVPTLTKENDGSVTIGNDGVANFNKVATGDGLFVRVNCSTGTNISLTDGAVNYLYANYNSGSPTYAKTTDSTIFYTDARLIPLVRCTREGTIIHFEEFDTCGLLLSNKMMCKDVHLHGFERQSGLGISTAATRVVTVAEGIVWFGVQYWTTAENISGISGSLYEYYLSSSSWTRSANLALYDSLYYSDGADRQTLDSNKYVSKYFFRDVGDDNEVYYIHGNQYNSYADALNEHLPTPPPVMYSHSIYIGKIVIKQGDTNGVAYSRDWSLSIQNSGVVNHNDLSNIDGGNSTQRYHMTLTEYNSIATIAGKKPFHGIVSRNIGTTNPLPTTITTTTFTLGATANPIQYWYIGELITVSTDKTAVLDDGAGGSTAGIYFIYFNGTTGNILATKNFPGIAYNSNVFFAFIKWNGTNLGLVYDERHNHTRDIDWHSSAHDGIGVRYYPNGGLALTINTASPNIGTTFATTAGEILDEDIHFLIASSSDTTSSNKWGTVNAARHFYQASAISYSFDSTLRTYPYLAGTAGRPQYVLVTDYSLVTASSATNRYFNYFVYASADLLNPIYIVAETLSATIAGTNGYTSLANARAVGFPNLSGKDMVPELKAIYRIIVRADGIVQAIDPVLDDYRLVSSLPQAAGSIAVSAAQVTATPYNNLKATNVASQLYELSDYNQGYTTTVSGVASPTVLDVTSRRYQFVTGTSAHTFTLPVTSTIYFGRTFEFVNNSTQSITINSSGGDLVQTVTTGMSAKIICVGIALTTDADWAVKDYNKGTNTGDQTVVANLTGGNATTLKGSIPYQNDTDDTELLSPNVSTTRKYLSSLGDGTNGTVPSWEEVPIVNLEETITQATHGFVKGDVLYYNGTAYAKSMANTEANAEVDGIVTTYIDAGSFKITKTVGTDIDLTGVTDDASASLVANTVYFLSTTVAGKLTSTQPTTVGYINKNVLKTKTTTSGVFSNGRGAVISSLITLEPVAPAATYLNVVGITNGETLYSNKALFNASNPSTQAFGDSAVIGTSLNAARQDHKHAMPAAPTSVTGNAGTVTNGVYTTDKEASGGIAGLTLFKINFRNAANTFTSFFTNANSAARTYTFQDKDGTVAMSGDAIVRTIATKTAAYTIATTDDLIICTANTFTLSLYAVSGNTGKQIEIKNGGTGVITVQANASELIDDINYLTLYQYDSIRLVCDGSKWHIL